MDQETEEEIVFSKNGMAFHSKGWKPPILKARGL
jgi:hypothetical protein